MRQRSLAIEEFDELRNFIAKEEDYYFFKTERDVPRRVAKSLRGPWAKDIDASKTNIVLRTKILPATTDDLYEDYDSFDSNKPPVYTVEDINVLLSSRGEAIVTTSMPHPPTPSLSPTARSCGWVAYGCRRCTLPVTRRGT